MRIVVGITGSSGAVYALDFLKRCPADKFLIVSKWGKALLKDELNLSEKDLQPHVKRQFPNDDLTAPLASGSNRFDAFVLIPCSTSTLGKIASGIGDTLITRTARNCVLASRQTCATARLSMSTAIARSGRPADAIGYVNYHGTSTMLNDAVESRCTRQVFGAHRPASAMLVIAGMLDPAWKVEIEADAILPE